jgi:hypothetical protein
MKYLTGPITQMKEIDISLPDTIKRIGIAMSGGADSAILLYILAKLNKESGGLHQLIPFTIPRPDGGATYSPAIVKWINNKLGLNIANPLIFGDGNIDHTIVVAEAIQQLLNSCKVTIVYLGETKIPPITVDAMLPTRSETNSWERVKMPFWDLTKDYVLSLYYSENVEDLLNYSHSCTQEIVGRCNVCFNCVERAWAFSSLNKTDTGAK